MTARLNRPTSMKDLIAKDGSAVLGNPDPCVHCGAEAKPYEVVTPRLGWTLMFWIPPVNCCVKNRKGRP